MRKTLLANVLMGWAIFVVVVGDSSEDSDEESFPRSISFDLDSNAVYGDLAGFGAQSIAPLTGSSFTCDVKGVIRVNFDESCSLLETDECGRCLLQIDVDILQSQNYLFPILALVTSVSSPIYHFFEFSESEAALGNVYLGDVTTLLFSTGVYQAGRSSTTVSPTSFLFNKSNGQSFTYVHQAYTEYIDIGFNRYIDRVDFQGEGACSATLSWICPSRDD